MSEELKETTMTEEGTAPETPIQVEPVEPVKPKKNTAPKAATPKATMANLNAWEKEPVPNGEPKEVVELPNGITAYHY